jgi:hypothetical protein
MIGIHLKSLFDCGDSKELQLNSSWPSCARRPSPSPCCRVLLSTITLCFATFKGSVDWQPGRDRCIPRGNCRPKTMPTRHDWPNTIQSQTDSSKTHSSGDWKSRCRRRWLVASPGTVICDSSDVTRRRHRWRLSPRRS